MSCWANTNTMFDQTDESDRRTVVLVGVTGDGKSSTGNTLAAQDAFRVAAGFSSATQTVEHQDYFYRGGRCWRVIDTIGLHDTGLAAGEVMVRFSAFADRAIGGIDCFLFVVRWGRWKPEHDAALGAFVRNAGESALAHTVLVFTHCTLSDDELQQALAEAPPSLRAQLPKLRGTVGVDNLGAAAASAATEAVREALHRAVEAVVASNDGARYSNDCLAAVRAEYDEREEEGRQAFAAALADWRKGTGAIEIVRECGPPKSSKKP